MNYNGKTFLTIRQTVEVTGLSTHYLRNGCRTGTVPHITSGNRFLINVPLLIEGLNRESASAGNRQEAQA